MTELNQIVNVNGDLNVRFKIGNSWHRTMIPAGFDVDQQIAAVNADLVGRGYEPVSDEIVALIKKARA